MHPLPSSPAVLLHHDGELGDVRALLDELGARYVERLGAVADREPTHGFDLIVASPRRALHFRPGDTRSAPKRIAILDGDSKTLRAHLRRVRTDLIVRRPVHPAVLRLVLLHALYRGPERRRLRRVSIGAEVKVRSRLRARTATMTDLSLRGARLLAAHALPRGRRVALKLPARMTGESALVLRGIVIRSGPATAHDPGLHVMAVRLDEPSPATRPRLEAILDAHASGPAMLEAGAARAHAVAPACAQAPERDTRATTAETRAPSRPLARPPEPVQPVDVIQALEPVGDATEDAYEGAYEGGDRRRAPRHQYDRRVVALGDAATRVLLGRDISSGGMRIDTNASLALGDRLRLALHAGERAEPVVVEAVVQRDDGEQGLVLRFAEVEASMRPLLDELLGHLPLIAGDGGEDEDELASARVVSEILEQHAG